jgi:PAS domain S-box-containing protein
LISAVWHSNCNTADSTDPDELQKKAPIAILSILSPIVPFLQNLASSLKLLAPHLATSFANAYHYTSAHRQASGILQRRLYTGHQVGFAPFAADSEGLQHLMEADIDTSNDSTTGSITSPSDYSGRSRTSPGGSILGTPGLDTISMFSRQSVGSTPGQGAEMIDSYFDAKKKSNSARVGSSVTLAQLAQSKGRESPTVDQRPAARKTLIGDEDLDTPIHEQRTRSFSHDEKSAIGTSKRLDQSSLRSTKLTSTVRQGPKPAPIEHHAERKYHSLLHSYGADFSSTFQSLPVTTTPSGRGPSPNKGDEVRDIPPPSERLLRTIIDSLPVQIFTAAPGSGALTWVNSKFVAYRGKEPHEIIQDPWSAIHPIDRVQYMEQWQRSLSTGQPFAHKVRLHRFDNVYRWFFVRATPLKDKKQNIVHWTGTYMDIHEQHVAETNAARQQETAASEAKYRALANSSPQIVFVVTRTRGVTFCNSQWLTYSGQTEAQARALGFMDFVHSDDLGKCRLPTLNEDGSAAVDVKTTMPPEPRRQDSSRSSSDGGSSETDRTITSPGTTSPPQLPQAKLSMLASTGIVKVSRDSDGRPSYSTEVRLRNKEGDYRWHLVRVLLSSPVRSDDEEEEETWYGTCTDINDHKLLEQTLKDTMDAKSRFLSNMSHEIRTPLNGITGMVNFLIDSSLTLEQLEHVHIIRNSTEGLRDLINDILDLSKVEAGMITLQKEWLHIRTLIEEVNDLTAAMATGKGLELNYLIEDGVPSMVKGDRFRIRQVLLNVVGNAIKFTQQGEVFVHCQVFDEKPSDLAENDICLLFQVMDTGSGFTEKEAEFLFKRFSQIDSSITKQHSGTGLGLAISMQLVELHGGRMRATSVPGKGSTFTFTLKFSLPSKDDQPPPPITTPGFVSVATTPAMTPAVPRPAASYTPGLPPMIPNLQSKGSYSGSDSSSYPSPFRSHHPDSAASSGSSDPSIRTGQTSVGSHRSSASSLSEAHFAKSQPMALELPAHLRGGRPVSIEDAHNLSSNESLYTVRPSSDRSPSPGVRSPPPPMFSILVVCPLPHSRRATVKHIEMTIPRSSAHHITAPDSLDDCKRLLGITGNDEPVIFTHVIVSLHEVANIISITDQVLRMPSYSGTTLLIISDFQQRKEIEEQAVEHNYRQLSKESNRLRWVFKPLKPSKFAIIFDPQKQRELSTDRSKDSAQAVVVNQKQVFDELRGRLGNKGFRVLLVEDNKTNQMVHICLTCIVCY